MSINENDTKLILQLATYAAKSVVLPAVKENTKEIFDRVNKLHDKQVARSERQADRIDKAIDLLAGTGETLAATVAKVGAIQESIAGLSTEDYAESVAKKAVEACSNNHRKEARAKASLGVDKISMLVAVSALVISSADKIGSLFSGFFTGP